MSPNEMMLAELIALRASVAALARTVLLKHGSEAFIQAEAQALVFAEITIAMPSIKPELSQRTERIVKDLFSMADGVGETK